jgi:hypothetical protein
MLSMKWLISILILATVLIAGCTQQNIETTPSQTDQSPSHSEFKNGTDYNFSSKNETVEISRYEVTLSFEDNITRCYLNGEVFLNNVSVGNTTNGNIILDNNVFSNDVNEVYIDGKLDYCFGNYSGWMYDAGYWTINRSELDLRQDFLLIEDIKPREGKGKLAMNYVTPNAVKGGVSSNSLSSIWGYMRVNFRYVTSQEQFGEYYWQLPSEFLKSGRGDCKEWATTFVSLALAGNRSMPCFVVEFSINETDGSQTGHAGPVCLDGGELSIYDQWYASRIWANEGIKFELDRWCQSIGMYGNMDIKSCNIITVFNDNIYKNFNTNQEFADWLKLNYLKS